MTQKSPIAVVGMAGLFPGATDLHTFWQNIVQKVDIVKEIPKDRWIPELYHPHGPQAHPDKAYSTRACLMDEKDYRVDSKDINLDPDLIQHLDPLHHLVLNAGHTLISDAKLSSITRDRIGISLAAIALPTTSANAITTAVFETAFEDALFSSKKSTPLLDGQYQAGRVCSYPAAIMAKAFDIRGATLTLDAACASSLYAVKIACDQLQAFETDAMIAGGVSRPDNIFTQVGFSQLRALSPSGRCAPFDKTADGLVVGEGIGLLMLKRLEDAVSQKDTIYGVICGIGLSNDMSGNLLAPDKDGQMRAMRAAYEDAGWQPVDVDLVECHGAGTPVGDTVELKSLFELWKNQPPKDRPMAIGSIKSMIGHLLTGAGAAGMIKTLLAFQHKTLPPSANFTQAPDNSPLQGGPFKVQTDAAPWITKSEDTPRRAAVSAFGFGGINGHILLEEWMPERWQQTLSHHKNASVTTSQTVSEKHPPATPMAIVGMGACLGHLTSLRDFQEAVFKGEPVFTQPSGPRWKGGSPKVAGKPHLDGLPGSFISRLTINPGAFHIPPNEIPDILPQQLLMLQVAAAALKDADLPLRGKRLNMSSIIGIGFDFETTNFYLRWRLFYKVRQWNSDYGLNLSPEEVAAWTEDLANEYSPPLTSARTLGNLGSIVASRVAREFQFGGPSFTVSNEEASGLTALKLAATALSRNEIDAALVGAVDFCGDLRSILSRNAIYPFSKTHTLRPFDETSDGGLPGEGAVALVIKRLDDAIRENHRIYAVITNMGTAAKGSDAQLAETYARSLENTFSKPSPFPESISLIDTHGSGHPTEDTAETTALHNFFAGPQTPADKIAIGSLKPIIGHTGAVAGLASIAKSALCLYQEVLPPLGGYTTPKDHWDEKQFHMPKFAHYWVRNRADGPRKALAGAITMDGMCSHVLLEEAVYPDQAFLSDSLKNKITQEKRKPMGWMPSGLFVVTGIDKPHLVQNLDLLISFIQTHPSSSPCLETVSRQWFQTQPPDLAAAEIVSIVGTKSDDIISWTQKAKEQVAAGAASTITARSGFAYTPTPLGCDGKIAFVYPGSGNHYLGMGRDLSIYWPEVLRQMDAQTDELKNQMLPECYIPWRTNWENGWEADAEKKVAADAKTMIFGQVVHGEAKTRLINLFGISPHAVIGYSLGQSVGYFATNAWPDKGEMLARIAKSDLFTTQLAGPCTSARKAWQVPENETIDWTVAVVNRPAEQVKQAIPRSSTARLLIVNTYDQCVIGGRRPHIMEVISALNCESVFLDGVVTVHCDAAEPVADAYEALHVFPVTQPEGITYYSCADGKAQELTTQSAARSIRRQATKGFDFTKTIKKAYEDGIRIFLELGPHASCTGMIRSILEDRPHAAVSACFRGENDYLTLVKCLGILISEHVPVNLENLYGLTSYPKTLTEMPSSETPAKDHDIVIPIGGHIPTPKPFKTDKFIEPDVSSKITERVTSDISSLPGLSEQQTHPEFDVIHAVADANKATVGAHEEFLAFSSDLYTNYAKTLELQTRMLMAMANESGKQPLTTEMLKGMLSGTGTPIPDPDRAPDPTPAQTIAFSREDCMEFAIGSVAKVLGPDFAVIDSYEKRVRLPDEPLMLVDRIITVEGEKRSLGSGRIVTEHDVLENAWYLDAGKAPVCISVEAGQADLFLCAYLGIDHVVKGKRAYRLLDATVEFHRELPRPGDTIQYDISIDRFVKQGETYLFFFNFKGFIKDTHLITMTNGCAGFFTEEEVKNSGGIIVKEEDRQPRPGIRHPEVDHFVLFEKKVISDTQLNALRQGDLETCFGPAFKGITLANHLRIPSGPMTLIDRILELDPAGGRYGLGKIVAEADIHPDDWFLTCHFMDDMVMPGTLMYECCAHTFRVFLQQTGWITDHPHACYEPMIGNKSVLKCRGPVTPHTKHVHYEVEVKEIGYGPEPYALADAHMYADGHRIVLFNDMSLKLSHVTGEDLRRFWHNHQTGSTPETKKSGSRPVFTRAQLEEFALGRPSKAFGDAYKAFDKDRFIARLPNPPFLLMDRVLRCEPRPWALKPDGWMEAAYDISEKDWYFAANRNASLPYVILLEIALQPCGWLAAYMGSALKSDKDLKFRNLDGEATLYRDIVQGNTSLTIRSRCTQVSTAGEMIIEQFDFSVSDVEGVVYEGNTTFGFFTHQAMEQQKGLPNAESRIDPDSAAPLQNTPYQMLSNHTPLFPEDTNSGAPVTYPAMPAKALLMVDAIDTWLPDGGAFGLGYIRGTKKVDPAEWFFKAHFFQDPVCPGSLGIESFLQLLKFVAKEKWGDTYKNCHFEMLPDTQHKWTYRGQVVPENKIVVVEAVITDIKEAPCPMIVANGHLKVDDKYIYEMKHYGICMKPNQENL